MTEIKPATDEEIEKLRRGLNGPAARRIFDVFETRRLLARLDAERARAEKAERDLYATIAELGEAGRREGQAVAAAEADASAARAQLRRYRDALYRIAGGANYADDPWDIARFALKFEEKQQ